MKYTFVIGLLLFSSQVEAVRRHHHPRHFDLIQDDAPSAKQQIADMAKAKDPELKKLDEKIKE